MKTKLHASPTQNISMIHIKKYVYVVYLETSGISDKIRKVSF